MNWLFFAFSSLIFFGLYNFFVKLSADKIGAALGVIYTTGTALLVALIFLVYLKFIGHEQANNHQVIIYPILAGVFTGIAEISYFLMFQKNVHLNIGNPLVVGGTVAVAVILGIIFLKEPLDLIKVIGIIAVAGGIILLSR